MSHFVQVVDENGNTAAEINVSGDLSALYAELEGVRNLSTNGEGSTTLSRVETVQLVGRLPHDLNSMQGIHIVQRELADMLDEDDSSQFTFNIF